MYENDGYNFCFAPQGWQCPICKRVYSPMTSMCFTCGKKETYNSIKIDGVPFDELGKTITASGNAPEVHLKGEKP